MKKMIRRTMAWLILATLLCPCFGTIGEAFASTQLTELTAILKEHKNVLYLTEDMVQEDGNIKVADEILDCIVLAKELTAKTVFLLNVNAKEFVMESGTECTLELVGGDIAKLTIVEPQIATDSYEELLQLLNDGMNISEAGALYTKAIEHKEEYSKQIPSVIVKAQAEIDTISVMGNVNLNLTEGIVDKVDVISVNETEELSVDIEGYAGNVAVQQLGSSTNNNRTNITLKKANVQNMDIESHDAICCINSIESSVEKMDIRGNAGNVYVFTNTSDLSVTKNAENMDIIIYSAINSLTVKGKSNNIWMSDYAKVENESITSGNSIAYMFSSSPWTNSGSSNNTIVVPEEPDVPEVPVADRVSREAWICALVDALGIEVATDDQYSFDDFSLATQAKKIESAIRHGLITLTADQDNIYFFDPLGDATREFVAETVMHGLRFSSTETVDATWADVDAVVNINAAALMIDYEMLELLDNCFAPERVFTKDELASTIDVLSQLTESTDIDTEITATIEYAEEVVQITALYEVDEEAGIITIPATMQRNSTNFEVGEIYVFQSADGSEEDIAVRITNLTEQNGSYKIEYEEPSIGEVVNNFDVVGSTTSGGTMTPAEGVQFIMPMSRSRSIGSGEIPLFSPTNFTLNMNDDEIVSGTIHLKEIEYRFIAEATWLPPFINIEEVYIALNSELSIDVELEFFEGIEEEYKLCNFDVPLGYGFNASGEIYLTIDAEAGISTKIVINETAGVQYQRGSWIRPIYTLNPSLEPLSIEGNAKAGLAAEVGAEFLGMNLVSVGSKAGAAVGVEASMGSISTVCTDANVYMFLDIYAQIGPEVFNLELEKEIFNADNSPLRKNLHLENFSVVTRCTQGSSAYKGYVKDAGTTQPIAGAKVQILKNGRVLDTRYTDIYGMYTGATLNVGTYTLRMSAAGYVPYEQSIEIIGGQTNTFATQLMIERVPSDNTGSGGSDSDSEETKYTVAGSITDIINGLGVPNVEITVFSVSLAGNDEILTTVYTDSLGDFSFEAERGNYALVTNVDGYTSNTKYVTVSAAITNVHFSINPINQDIITDSETLRAVLHWGEYPHDLDSHMVGENNAGEFFHVYFAEMNSPYVNLDVDDITSYGPETITIAATGSALEPTTYSYYVHDYSNKSSTSSTELAASGAYVELYSGNRLLFTIHVPVDQEGTLWHVLDYDLESGRVSLVNAFAYEEYPDEVGMVSSYSSWSGRKNIEK